jgi:diacylglycerol kinase (ATP)
MTVRCGERIIEGSYWIAVAGNSERAGGNSLCIAPGSRTDDGVLNMSLIRAQSKLEILTKLMIKAPRGAHVRDRRVEYFPAASIRVESDPSCVVDVDGDRVGTTPATFTVCPRAVEFYGRFTT